MRCDEAIEYLDEYLEDGLKDEARAALDAHLQGCPGCREVFAADQALVAELRNLPVPTPAEDFFERAITRAVRAHEHQQDHHRTQHRRMAWRYAAGGALAASLVLGVILNVSPPTSGPTVAPMAAIPGLTIGLHEVQKVRLSVGSHQTLQHAVFTVELPEGVELAGFPNQRTVRWEGSLHEGKNLLELPLVAQDRAGGVLVARIDHAKKEKVFRLQLNVQPDRGATRNAGAGLGWV